MLISFTVSNFRSFGDEATLNMVASNKITQHPEHRVPFGSSGQAVLRTAVIYGANAAGKSNLVKAIGLAQELVTSRNQRNRPVEPFGGIAFIGQPSTFDFRFLVGDRVFVYGFDILVNRVMSEWLALVNGDDEVTIFDRGEDGVATINPLAGHFFTSDSMMFDTLSKLQELPSRKEQLFLNRALSVPEDVLGTTLRSIIDWFAKDLIVLPPGSRSSDLIEKLASDEKLKEFCAAFLSNVGTGIGDLVFSETKRPVRDWERSWVDQSLKIGRASQHPWGESDSDIRPIPGDPSAVVVRRLIAEHPMPSERFSLPFSSESDGTQSLLHLLPTVAAPNDESRVLVLDELDRSLHPMLTWELLRFFSESRPGVRKQLIATTHEAYLLNQELLRRDEYWFAEKDERQQTHIYSLSDFAIRNDLKLQKGYLQGRFGAIPLVHGMQDLERLLECSMAEGVENATKKTDA